MTRHVLTYHRRNDPNKKLFRSRSNTGTSGRDQFNNVHDMGEMGPPQPPRPSVRPNQYATNSLPQSPIKEIPEYDFPHARPAVNRAVTYDLSSRTRDSSPASMHSMHRVPSDTASIRNQRTQLRPVSKLVTDMGVDNSDASTHYSNDTNSPDRFQDDAFTPSTSYGSVPSRNFSSGTLNSISGRKAPPPPPPPRSKKPPPPPPPMKRAGNSSCA